MARGARSRHARATGSPVPADKRDELLPLRYFPPDPSYIVPAELKLADERPVVEMPTSTGTLRRMQRVGMLEFTLQGQALSLGAFVEAGQPDRSLFVPFADTTTGPRRMRRAATSTSSRRATGLYTIDFNYAYNPYCAYNERVRVPVSAAFEPAEGAVARRREGAGRMSGACRRSSSTSTA